MVGDGSTFFPLMVQATFFSKGLDRKYCRFGVNRAVTWLYSFTRTNAVTANEQTESRGYTVIKLAKKPGKRTRLIVWTAGCQALVLLWVIQGWWAPWSPRSQLYPVPKAAATSDPGSLYSVPHGSGKGRTRENLLRLCQLPLPKSPSWLSAPEVFDF